MTGTLKGSSMIAPTSPEAKGQHPRNELRVPSMHLLLDEETRIGSYVMPNAFIAAVIGSEKKMGSTRSTMSPATSKK